MDHQNRVEFMDTACGCGEASMCMHWNWVQELKGPIALLLFLIRMLPRDNKIVEMRNSLLIEVIHEEGILEHECHHYQGHDQQWLSIPKKEGETLCV